MRNEEPIAWSMHQVCNVTGLGRTKIYELLKRGELTGSFKVGSRRLFLRASVLDFVRRLSHS